MSKVADDNRGVKIGAFEEWGSVDDFKFPFGRPSSNMYLITAGYVKLYNAMRRGAESVSLDWIKSRITERTDKVLTAWMRSNTGLLRIVSDECIEEFYNDRMDDITSEVGSYMITPNDYTGKLSVYIKYVPIDGEFELVINRLPNSLLGDYHEGGSTEVLNAITKMGDLLEFIPIIVDDSFEVSHKAFKRGRHEEEAVSVSYLGRNIMNNSSAMKRLVKWFDEGNAINPNNKYFILATRSDRRFLYLRRDKEE